MWPFLPSSTKSFWEDFSLLIESYSGKKKNNTYIPCSLFLLAFNNILGLDVWSSIIREGQDNLRYVVPEPQYQWIADSSNKNHFLHIHIIKERVATNSCNFFSDCLLICESFMNISQWVEIIYNIHILTKTKIYLFT